MLNLGNNYKNKFLQVQEESDKASKLLIRRDIELTEANEKLVQINKAKSEFISLAAHQLRTPVTTINWRLEKILSKSKDDLSEDYKKGLEQIYASSQHLSGLIDTLLLMSKLELGVLDYSKKHINLIKIKDDINDDFNILVKNKGIDYVFDVSTDYEFPEIYTDPNLLKSIFQNLLSNAIKYTPESGAVKAEIRRNNKGKQFGGRVLDNDSLCFSVEDTGFGIPKENQKRIFERLFRAGNIVDKNIQGTGLGLSIVKLIVEQLRGKIWFTSEEGRGSRFYVTIPLHILTKD